MKTSANKNRIWELDFLRGMALLFMIWFHLVYDMKEFFNFSITYESGINYYVGKAAGILFITLAGISCSLSRSNIKRGLKVLGIAMIITVASHMYNPGYGIKFGILHLLGVSMLLSPLLQRLNKFVLPVLGTLVIALQYIFIRINVPFDYLFPFGIYTGSFVSSDYYPLIPWFGLFLYGIALGKFFYSNKQSILNLNIKDNIINLSGRHTLIIYLLHQPVILVVLELIRKLG